jgi:hypothetical protein
MINPSRFGLFIILLLVGVLISWLSTELIILFFSLLGLTWFISWDEKSYKKLERKRNKEAEQYHQHYPS